MLEYVHSTWEEREIINEWPQPNIGQTSNDATKITLKLKGISVNLQVQDTSSEQQPPFGDRK